MKIVAFAGSTSSTSINKKLVEHTLKHFGESDINLLDLNDYSMPIFSSDEEKKGTPEQAHKFLQCIEEADAIVCSFAEHNSNFATAFKNVFDWASRINKSVFQDKPMLIMATSPGGYGGKNVLDVAQKTLPHYGGNIKGVFSLPKFGQNFDANEGITNPELKQEHINTIENFKQQIAQ
ncbi:NADPH-dependent FMN reductase [Bergeyella zoohelcum]|uniref:FMN-dependent NADPH-azoreductase n=1 Tax=Bergeyella zoohelcum TaxID=1015 RepID=A0A7Z8YP04_9FLAO|nr:NAD(P)H-dependent oxidoreductase [Bergeyella zoohelcum]VDH04793.1 FMN-dependent NADPH-azoreductase [Bergeyella zoohelcum]